MATCLCDAFYADVARAAVEVLEFAGCEVVFPEDQTCCGQPPFNGGDFETSRKIARHTMRTFADADLPVIVPSGSCAAMHRHGNLLQFEDQPDLEDARDLARRTWELTDYLVNGLKIVRWPGRHEGRLALHHACHTRGSATGHAITRLLSTIEGLDVVPVGQGDQCCGFGGTFAVTFPHISREMGRLKLEHLLEKNPQAVVSADMSCLMHLCGLAGASGMALPVLHVAQVLRNALTAPVARP